MTIAQSKRNLDKALRRLERATGPVALRNARRAVLTALRSLRKAVDDEKPAPKRKAKRRRKPRSIIQRRRDLRLDGWVQIANAKVVALLSQAGIKTQLSPSLDPRGATQIWAPSWAVLIAQKRPSALRWELPSSVSVLLSKAVTHEAAPIL